MQKEERRFRLVKFKFETDKGGIIERYMLTDSKIPMFEVNQWIEAKSLRKPSTGKEYGNKLAVFLNFIDAKGIEYDKATNSDVLRFIQKLIYGDLQNLQIKSIETMITPRLTHEN